MKGCYKGVLCRMTEYRAMGKTAPALSYISSPDQETMLRAGFTEVRNGLWLKVLTEEEFEEVAAEFEKHGRPAYSDKK